MRNPAINARLTLALWMDNPMDRIASDTSTQDSAVR